MTPPILNHSTRRQFLTQSAAALAAPWVAPLILAQSAKGANEKLNLADAARAKLESRLFYDEPATAWIEALPIGNGSTGAMIFGGAQNDHLQLNHDTLWAGRPVNYLNPDATPEVLAEVRSLLLDGKQGEAEQAAWALMSRPLGQMPYQPFGDLHLETGHAAVTDYQRELNLETAVSTVSYTVNGVRHRRTYFASYPDGVIVVRLEADQPGAVDARLSLSSPHVDILHSARDAATLAMRGRVAPRDLGPGAAEGPESVRFEGQVRVRTEGGETHLSDEAIEVRDADAATFVVALATSYLNYADITGDPAARCTELLNQVEAKSYEQLRRAHVEDYQKLFERCRLRLGEEAPDAPRVTTDRRLRLHVEAPDPALEALVFEFGRYLLIACSRPGSQPANLQGLWNDQLNPPWECKYTANINVEMNYWPAELTGLSECHEPLFAMLEDLRVTGERVAREHYGMPGWVLHHNTDGWRGAAAINATNHGLWPTGGAWLCQHLWWHYQFTGDETFLREQAYPIMKGASEFFVQWLIEEPKYGKGWLISGPSNSPEAGGLVMGPTMDHQIIRHLFESTAKASEILAMDAELRVKLRDMHQRIAPNQVGSEGQLREWMYKEIPFLDHRHVSHMWGLHPGEEINENTPELMAAARRTLELRGPMGIGWSLAWKISLYARLGEGERAHKMIGQQLQLTDVQEINYEGGGGTYPNLLSACPPFQIDANLGYPAGVAEMLLQSHLTEANGTRVIDLLPALPTGWAHGEVRGLRTRDGFTVDMRWEQGVLAEVTITSMLGQPCVVRYRKTVRRFEGAAGTRWVLDEELIKGETT